MEAPSSTLKQNSRPLRPKRRDPESRFVAPHLKTSQAEYTDLCTYTYESLLRTSRPVPPNTPTFPSPTIGIGSAHAPKYHDLLDPRSHKSPALSLPPPQASSRPPRRNAPATYPYVAPPVRDWPSRDPIGERGGINLYGMVGNDAVGSWDFLGLVKKCSPEMEKIWKEEGCVIRYERPAMASSPRIRYETVDLGWTKWSKWSEVFGKPKWLHDAVEFDVLSVWYRVRTRYEGERKFLTQKYVRQWAHNSERVRSVGRGAYSDRWCACGVCEFDKEIDLGIVNKGMSDIDTQRVIKRSPPSRTRWHDFPDDGWF